MQVWQDTLAWAGDKADVVRKVRVQVLRPPTCPLPLFHTDGSQDQEAQQFQTPITTNPTTIIIIMRKKSSSRRATAPTNNITKTRKLPSTPPTSHPLPFLLQVLLSMIHTIITYHCWKEKGKKTATAQQWRDRGNENWNHLPPKEGWGVVWESFSDCWGTGPMMATLSHALGHMLLIFFSFPGVKEEAGWWGLGCKSVNSGANPRQVHQVGHRHRKKQQARQGGRAVPAFFPYLFLLRHGVVVVSIHARERGRMFFSSFAFYKSGGVGKREMIKRETKGESYQTLSECKEREKQKEWVSDNQ